MFLPAWPDLNGKKIHQEEVYWRSNSLLEEWTDVAVVQKKEDSCESEDQGQILLD